MNSRLPQVNRRTFLHTLLSLPAALLGGAAPAVGQTAGRRTTIGRFHVAGFQYHRGPALITAMRRGDPLRLVAEPRNPYDGNAVRIEYGGEHIGYVPRRENQGISGLLRDGARVEARVIDSRPNEEPWRMLRVEAALSWS